MQVVEVGVLFAASCQFQRQSHSSRRRLLLEARWRTQQLIRCNMVPFHVDRESLVPGNWKRNRLLRQRNMCCCTWLAETHVFECKRPEFHKTFDYKTFTVQLNWADSQYSNRLWVTLFISPFFITPSINCLLSVKHLNMMMKREYDDEVMDELKTFTK